MRKAFFLLLLIVVISTTVYAQNETANTTVTPQDPCAGITCNSPPAALCEDSNLRTYSSPGTCNNGICSYPSSVSTCQYGCNNGVCVPQDACANVVCNTPYASYCSGSNLVVYTSPGTCNLGVCSYPTSVSNCPNGCSNGACKNFCDTSSCGSESKTCPDGFVSSCQKSCDRATQSCTSCEPSCEGHNVVQTANTTTSSGGGSGGGAIATPANTSTSSGGGSGQATTNTSTSSGGGGAGDVMECVSGDTTYATCSSGASYIQKNCVNGKWIFVNYFMDPCSSGSSGGVANTTTSGGNTTTCPMPQAVPVCSPDAYLEKKIDDRGCVVEYRCQRSQNQTNCMQIQTFAVDGSGKCSTFSNSCLPPGWTRVEKCPESKQQCPPGCECKYDSNNIVATSCPTQKGCNYNGMCDKDEDSSCKDCIGGECPISQKCPGGAVSTCQKTESGCACSPCPVPTADLPAGCTQETDSTGFVRVNCQKSDVKCATVPQEVRLKCVNSNGLPRFGRDSNGCDTFQCDFGGERSNAPVFATPVKCPSPEEVSNALEKCKSLNMEGVVGFEGGCKIGKCINQNNFVKGRECPNPTESEKKMMEEKCKEQGLGLVFEFDGECHEPKCGQRNDCQKELPKEAYSKCAQKGGQLIVRHDDRGCISFKDCIIRGEESSSFVENINEVPDAGELLSIAFKLEDLKMQFDKLSKKTDDIANYYQSTGSNDEKRFRRVSDMFMSAKDKVDEIKTKLRDKISNINTDDILEIKQDLRYLKDVVLKDILFVMLSSGDEVNDITGNKATECGTDESCFDRAIRVCQQITYMPQGRDGIVVKIKGLDGDACILYALLPENKAASTVNISGISPPYEMTCKIQKYSLGLKNPDTDIIPYCEGNLKEIMKYDKSKPEGKRQGVGMCGDSICDDKEQKDPQGCPQDCGPLLSKPPQQRTATEQQMTVSQPMQGGGQLCPDGICDNFEQKNPNACPQDCGSASTTNQETFQTQHAQTFVQPETASSKSQACSGCLNNGVCDPGECSGCADCL